MRINIVSLSDKECLNNKLVGGKGYNLARLSNIPGLNTKPGGVVTADVYIDIVRPAIKAPLERINQLVSAHHNNLGEVKEELNTLFEQIQSIIMNLDLSSIFSKDEIRKLGLEPNKHYAVRSSGTAEDGTKASFSGKFATQLYVKDKDVLNELKTVWASAFTLSNLEYCMSQEIDFNGINMAVVVQEMSHPVAAGTMFTHNDTIEIDTCLGLGEGVVRGDMRTDKIVLDHGKNRIIYTQTSEKEIKLEYDAGQGKVAEKKLTKDESTAFSISTAQIHELIRQAKLVEGSEHYSRSKLEKGLDMEFCCDKDGHVYLVQVRPVTVEDQKNKEQVDYSKSQKMHMGSGSPVSAHVASGVLAICDTPEDAFDAIAKYSPQKVVIVTANTTSQWESAMRQSAAVIAEIGSSNCHTAIACREMEIPGITNFADATKHLKQFEGQPVTVCGTSGKLYQGARDKHVIIRTNEVQTNYTPIETEETVSIANHLKGAQGAKMTMTVDDVVYIGKPITPTCEFINQLDKKAHEHVQDALGLHKASFLITDNQTFLMNFDDCHEWRRDIRKWDLDQHKQILELRKNAEKEYQDATEQLELTQVSMQRWINAYKSKIGFDNIAYAVGEIITGILHQSAKGKGIREPILSALLPAEIACMGHFEIEQCNEALRAVHATLAASPVMGLLKELEVLYASKEANVHDIAKKEKIAIEKLKEMGLFDECKRIAMSYRILEKDFALTFLEPWFQESSAPWLRLLVTSKKLTGAQPQALSTDKISYYPDDPTFRPLIELAATSKKLHMDGHHTKARGMWKFIGQIEKLSQNTGYTIAELLSKNPDELIALVGSMTLSNQPGEKPREFTAAQLKTLETYERVTLSHVADPKKVEDIAAFVDALPTAESLKKAGFNQTQHRTVYAPGNTGLPAALEGFEDRMSDAEGVLPLDKYRGENVRPNRRDYTQHQIAVEDDGGRVITMVRLDQNKSVITLGKVAKQGKPILYSAPYKWENPALKLDQGESIHSENYDKITAYSRVLEQYMAGFREKNMLEQIALLQEFIPVDPGVKHSIVINSNTPAEVMPIADIVKKLTALLLQEQHIRAVTGKKSTVLYGRDAAAPKMQSIVRIPSRDQHEKFLEDTIFYINKWLALTSQQPIDEAALFEMPQNVLQKFLTDTKHDTKAQAQFFESLNSARKFKEYQRKPTIKTELEDGASVVVTMNDSIDIPSQALMAIISESNFTETNRPVNLDVGFRALYALFKDHYHGQMQNIVFSQLAYTQASSTQSMNHYHITPVYNSEGEFMVPYLDELNKDRFGEYQKTFLDNVQIAYLNDDIQENYYNLVKFKIQFSSDESENLKTLALLSHKLQRFETEHGADMTWVAKLNPGDNTMTMCVELRAGINLYSQHQIDDFRSRNLWEKIGFTEVMGKRYSMLSQANFDAAVKIYDGNPVLKAKILATPLFAIQIGKHGDKSFYEYKDDEVKDETLDAKKIKDVLHIARVIQLYDAERLTTTVACMHHLHQHELADFKKMFEKQKAKNTLAI